MAAKSTTQKDPREITSFNLKELISKMNTTQAELSKKSNISQGALSEYCNGTRLPSTDFLLSLKKTYGISIDDFLTKKLTSKSLKRIEPKDDSSDSKLQVYNMYCGSYLLYYFDTSKYIGKDYQLPRESLQYGTLCIYKNTDADDPTYDCIAILGIPTQDEALLVYKEIERIKDHSKREEYVYKKYESSAYHGDFELTNEHVFISIKHKQTDKALIILQSVSPNNNEYTGGIGTINSVSKGRERMPVIQFIGISRYPIHFSEEEIHRALLLDLPTIDADKETSEMIANFKTLYVEESASNSNLTEVQKEIVVKSNLERYIKKSLENNVFRYQKISERNDDDWYHFLKQSQ